MSKQSGYLRVAELVVAFVHEKLRVEIYVNIETYVIDNK